MLFLKVLGASETAAGREHTKLCRLHLICAKLNDGVFVVSLPSFCASVAVKIFLPSNFLTTKFLCSTMASVLEKIGGGYPLRKEQIAP